MSYKYTPPTRVISVDEAALTAVIVVNRVERTVRLEHWEPYNKVYYRMLGADSLIGVRVGYSGTKIWPVSMLLSRVTTPEKARRNGVEVGDWIMWGGYTQNNHHTRQIICWFDTVPESVQSQANSVSRKTRDKIKATRERNREGK